MSVESIVDRAGSYKAGHVVVTGGEPMIAPDICELTGELRALGMHITIETAGTVYAPVACDLMSVSPKLSNSTPKGEWAERHDRLRIQPEVLQRLMDQYPYQLKFVISRPDDLSEIDSLLRHIEADRSKVVLMPEGIDSRVLQEKGLWLAEICKREGFRFSPRLHVDLYGNRRGV